MTGSPTRAAPPQAPLDVLVLQTAAALENLAVASYASAAALPFVAGGSAQLRALTARNLAHHRAHALAFNQAVAQAAGAQQHAPDARYAALVGQRLAGLRDPASLVDLLTELEDVNAQSCTRFATLTEGGVLRSLLVNVASVEAQHGSELLIVRTLLDGDTLLDAVTGPGAAGAAARAIPAAAGTAGIPQAAYSTADASAVDEGRVRVR